MSKVYVVVGYLNYENIGELAVTDTMQVFFTHEAAMAYGESLLVRKADSYEIIETTVR